jgi:hypothetical protein
MESQMTLEQMIEVLNKQFEICAAKFYAKGGPTGIKIKTSDVQKIIDCLTKKD